MKVIFFLAVLVGAFAGLARAQGDRPEPLYQSAFDGYRSWRTDDPVDWKRADDEMKAPGGHVGHLRGAPPAGAKPPARTRQDLRQPPAAGGQGTHDGER